MEASPRQSNDAVAVSKQIATPSIEPMWLLFDTHLDTLFDLMLTDFGNSKLTEPAEFPQQN